MSELPILSTSAAKLYRACARAFYIKYELGFTPVSVDDVLRVGTLWHDGQEAWWRTLLRAQQLPAAMKAFENEPDPYARGKAISMLVGYDARWGDADADQFSVIGVEVEFSGPLINPETGAESRTWRVGGKIDAIVRDRPTNRVYLIEHKTSAEDITPGSDYWQRLTLDSQASNYLAGARFLGYPDVAGVIYDVVRKPAQRPLRATLPEARKYTAKGTLYANQRDRDETPEEYTERVSEALAAAPEAHFVRGEIVRLESEKHEAAADLWAVGTQIKDARRLKLWPRNGDACRRYGRTCEYLDVCLGVASLEDETRFKKSEKRNAELTA